MEELDLEGRLAVVPDRILGAVAHVAPLVIGDRAEPGGHARALVGEGLAREVARPIDDGLPQGRGRGARAVERHPHGEREERGGEPRPTGTAQAGEGQGWTSSNRAAFCYARKAGSRSAGT